MLYSRNCELKAPAFVAQSCGMPRVSRSQGPPARSLPRHCASRRSCIVTPLLQPREQKQCRNDQLKTPQLCRSSSIKSCTRIATSLSFVDSSPSRVQVHRTPRQSTLHTITSFAMDSFITLLFGSNTEDLDVFQALNSPASDQPHGDPPADEERYGAGLATALCVIS